MAKLGLRKLRKKRGRGAEILSKKKRIQRLKLT